MISTNVNTPLHRHLKRCLQLSTKSIKQLISSIFVHKDKFLSSTNKSKVELQSRVIFFYFTLSYLTGICIAVFSEMEPYGIFYTYVNIAHGSCIIIILLAYLKRLISIRHAIALAFSISALEIIVEMFYQAMYDGGRGPFSIMTNMVLLACIASMSAMAYVKRLSLCISLASFIAYCICAHIAGSQEMQDYSYLLALAFIYVTFVGSHLAKTFVALMTENQIYKEEKEQLLNHMQLTKEQWSELMEALRVTGKKIDIDKTKDILELMEDRLQARLKYKVKEMLKEEQDYTTQLLLQCPSLTDMELKTANYIIKGMSSSEIASTLDSTVSTVTTVRSRMRSKFGLDKNTNLQSYLCGLVGQ